MTQELETRIAQIRRGEVPNGYKRTKLGILPTEWQVISFRRMFAPLSRRNTTGNTNVLTISAQHGLIRQTAFFKKNIASQNTDNYFLLKRGDFAYNKSYSNGYPFGVIKPLKLYDSGIVSPLYICCSPTDENQSPEYYAQYFDAGLMNREIHAFAQEGARNHGLLNISVYDFFDSSLPFPPLAEQREIAAILSAQDNVIALKERLLTEKQRQKQYLMQQLLTGKQRLPGFVTPWKTAVIGELGTFYGGLSGKNKDDFGTGDSFFIPFKNVLENVVIDGGQLSRVRLDKDEKQNSVKQYDLFFNLSSETVTEVGMCAVLMENLRDTYLNSFCVGFRLRESFVSPLWLSYYFNSPAGRKVMLTLAQGVTRINLNRAAFTKTAVPIPPIDEQRAIADILSAADREIDLLRRDLEQEQRRKKALSQLLLTGIVRTGNF